MSPPQTTLLKLLDSYLQAALGPTSTRKGLSAASEEGLGHTLSDLFFAYSDFLHKVIRQFIGGNDENSDQRMGDLEQGASSPPLLASTALDLHMPAVCAALVLVAQCITSKLLSEDSEADSSLRPEQEHEGDIGRDITRFNLKGFLISNTSPNGQDGMIECLIGERSLRVFEC